MPEYSVSYSLKKCLQNDNKSIFLKFFFDFSIVGHHHEITEDGLELTFQVNYLAHFLVSPIHKIILT